MARIGNIAFDCDDVLRVAAFWSAVLGRPIDQGSSKLFASIGGTDAERRERAWYFNKVCEGSCSELTTDSSTVIPMTCRRRLPAGGTMTVS